MGWTGLQVGGLADGTSWAGQLCQTLTIPASCRNWVVSVGGGSGVILLGAIAKRLGPIHKAHSRLGVNGLNPILP